jgi:hypothetical protein
MDARGIEELYRSVPAATFKEVHNAMGHIFAKARQSVVTRLPGTKTRGMKSVASKAVRYAVYPKRLPRAKGPVAPLHQIVGVLYTASAVADAHEFGRTIAPGKYMLIPIGFGRKKGTNRVKPMFAKRGPKGSHIPSVQVARRKLKEKGKDLISKRTKSGDVIYYRKTPVKSRAGSGKRKKRRANGKARNRARYKLEPVFLLTKEVSIRPSLGVKTTWNSLAGWRSTRLGQVPRAIVDAVMAKTASAAKRRAG